MVKQGEMPALFAGLMGDRYYIVRAAEMEAMKLMVDHILKLA